MPLLGYNVTTAFMKTGLHTARPADFCSLFVSLAGIPTDCFAVEISSLLCPRNILTEVARTMIK